MKESTGSNIEPGKYCFSDYEVSKKTTFLLRHSQQMHREENGAVHFCSERKSSEQIRTIYSLGRRSMKGMLLDAGGGEKRRSHYFTDASRTIVYFEALEKHLRRIFIDPSLQDNAVIPSNFIQEIYNIGCAFNLHSIINSR